MKTKPVVKYRQSTFMFAGRKEKLRYKLTLLATFKGQLARKLAERDTDAGLYWTYDDETQILEIYEEKMITPLDD